MRKIFRAWRESPPLQRLLELQEGRGRETVVTGLTEPLGGFLAAALLESGRGTVLLVTPGPRETEHALDDLVSLVGSAPVGFLPPCRTHPFDTAPLAAGPRNERTDALLRLAREEPTLLVTQPEALLEPGPGLEWLRSRILKITVGRALRREPLLASLAAADYHRESLVEAQGQFAVRGGLLDIFPFGFEHPVRVEFDGDTVAAMRRFDPATQRSNRPVGELTLLTDGDEEPDEGGIVAMLPDDAVVVWMDLDAISGRVQRHLERATKRRRSEGNEPPDPAPTGDPLERIHLLAERLNRVVWRGPLHDSTGEVDFQTHRPDPYAAGMSELAGYLDTYLRRGLRTWIAADTDGERERLDEMLAEAGLDIVATATPSISSGFVCPPAQLAVLASHELFGRRRMRARHTRFRRRAVQFDHTALSRGDLVVHREYGIGIYEGLQMVKVRGQPQECLRLRYGDGVILYVRVDQFGLVERFVGGENVRPKLSKLGTGDWARTKRKTRKALQDMTEELLKLSARRRVTGGYSFPEDTHWQRELEASFEFEDTPDQVTATVDVKRDLESSNPMDRLLCGDVGFGKTEIAVRAAFKVVQDSRQVAILVPTTILAQQHEETFRSRLGSFPVRVEVLSRFRSPAEQREVIAGLKSGAVDIVIGTHRLLSRDVGFKRLGLLVIDEEHRFGVRHKERLKQLKTDVDVLTLTATPIPRTLQMALSGVRDTTQISTPPVNRLPVQTEVHTWSEELIRDAIYNEMDRQGQVFFVHNRVQSIHAVRGMLERIAPGPRYAVAHGQMKERELERVMSEFLKGRHDVLVTTMIIESGLDIPNVNTLVVNRADKFGLAQLYQLRGRIGRSNRQAYAYLLTPPRLAMTPDATRRLATLTEMTELGSGFKVALRDLEIRGAGNLLGPQQSGFINAVGLDMYIRLLEEMVAEIKGEPTPAAAEEFEVRVDFTGPALLPVDYIDEGDLRYQFYRRIADARDLQELERVRGELTDRFGTPPEPAGNLMEIAGLKLMCRSLRFNRISVESSHLTLALDLPPGQAESQERIGRLVAAAAPEQVEFRLRSQVEMTYRFNSEAVRRHIPQQRLREAVRFLHRLYGSGILQA